MIRPFTYNDFKFFSGVEHDEDHTPMIRDGGNWFGICDLHIVEIYLEDITYCFGECEYEMNKLILDALPDILRRSELEGLGFELL